VKTRKASIQRQVGAQVSRLSSALSQARQREERAATRLAELVAARGTETPQHKVDRRISVLLAGAVAFGDVQVVSRALQGLGCDRRQAFILSCVVAIVVVGFAHFLGSQLRAGRDWKQNIRSLAISAAVVAIAAFIVGAGRLQLFRVIGQATSFASLAAIALFNVLLFAGATLFSFLGAERVPGLAKAEADLELARARADAMEARLEATRRLLADAFAEIETHGHELIKLYRAVNAQNRTDVPRYFVDKHHPLFHPDFSSAPRDPNREPSPSRSAEDASAAPFPDVSFPMPQPRYHQ